MSRTVTTQVTGKLWKALRLVGMTIMLVSIAMFVVAMNAADQNANLALVAGGILLFFFVGLPAYVLSRIGAWWFHG